MEGYFNVVFHHGGKFVNNNTLDYMGQTLEWKCDPDRWSYWEVLDILKEIGYEEVLSMFYNDPTRLVGEGLCLLKDDRGAMEVANLAKVHGQVHLYIIHPVSQPEVVTDATEGVHGEQPNVDGSEESVEGSDDESDDSALDINFEDSDDESDDDGFEVTSPIQCDKLKRAEQIGESGADNRATSENVKKKRGRPAKRAKAAQTSVDETEVGEITVDEEDEFDELHEGAVLKDKEQIVMDRGLSDSDDESEELLTDCDSDDATGSVTKYPIFKLLKDMAEYKWELGTFFLSREDFKEASTTYAVHSGRDLKFIKNDNLRVRVKCKEGCDWMAYCAKLPNEDTWQLRKVVDKHNCSREYRVNLLTTKWLSKKLKTSIKENPNLKVSDIKDKAQKKWNAGISNSKAKRARCRAMDMVDGSFREQYNRIYDYCHELLRLNPGSTVKLKVQEYQGDEADLEHPGVCLSPHFQRLYICFAACKESFLRCRPIIGLDGCFLKGYFGGEILAAVGRDPNDQMLPIAFAIVEGENKDSWSWFLQLLIDDIGGRNACLNYTFICDQQKGLLPALEELLPGVDQRFCVRHLYNNFRKKHPGKKLKDILWRAAKASYPQAWEKIMREMRSINEEAFKHMWQIPTRYWSKSRFKPGPKCDTLLNNMSEAFNSVIVGARGKPIVTMLEEIRTYLMERWARNRQKIASYEGTILPKIKKRLHHISDNTNMWLPRWSGEYLYEVRHINLLGDKFTVNLETRECSCRRWMLTGLPCCHAMTAMKNRNLNIEDYVPAYYKKEIYEVVYQPILHPVNGESLWITTQYPDVQAPPVKKMPGRPKKKRIREQGELEGDGILMSRRGFNIKCSRCKAIGHNKSTCKLPPPEQPTQPDQLEQPDQPEQPASDSAEPTSTPTAVPASTLRTKLPTRRAQPQQAHPQPVKTRAATQHAKPKPWQL